MAKKTSVHIKECNITSSELHNLRKRLLSYIRQELTHLNQSYNYTGRTLSAELKQIQQDVKRLTGRKIQKNAMPIKEGVVVIQESTTMEQLQEFCDRCHKELGLIPLQIHIHRDEGHKGSKEWKPNLHAHIVWRMYNEEGRNVRLTRYKCTEMQTILAECLGMERGKPSNKKHIDALQYKVNKTKEDLDEAIKKLEIFSKRGDGMDRLIARGKKFACQEIMKLSGLRYDESDLPNAATIGKLLANKSQALAFLYNEIQRRLPSFMDEYKKQDVQQQPQKQQEEEKKWGRGR